MSIFLLCVQQLEKKLYFLTDIFFDIFLDINIFILIGWKLAEKVIFIFDLNEN